MESVYELKTEAKSLHRKAGAILDKAVRENRDLTFGEQTSFDEHHKRIDVMAIQIESREDVASDFDVKHTNGKGVKSLDTKESMVFRKWLRGGDAALTDSEQRSVKERRAQSVGTTTGGGFLVPEDFREAVDIALLEFGGMRRSRATVINTPTGATLPMPTVNDTAQVAVILAENTTDTEQDVVYGSTTLSSYKYTSKVVRVSMELIQDSFFDYNKHLANVLGERIARGTNAHFTTGTGSAQPNGVVTASIPGKTGTTGQTTSVIYNDLVDLEHSVDPLYRVHGEWMMNDNSLAVVKKLVDGNGLPLWSQGIREGAPSQLLGYPIVINQDMPVMAANAKSILFGDFSKYMIRDVANFELVALRERYADFHQMGFIGFSRHDGDLLDAGTNPIKHYANSAT